MKALIHLLSLSLLLINPPAVAHQTMPLDAVQQPLPEHLRLGVTRAGWMPFIGDAEPFPLKGISGEALEDFAQMEGVSIEVVLFDNFQLLLEALQKGEIDFTSDVFATPERRLNFRFTQPYSHSHQGIIINQKSGPFFSLEELSGHTVAVEKGFHYASELQNRYPKVRLARVNGTEDALRAVSQGLADAYVGNLEVAHYLINTQQISGLRVSTALQSDLEELSFAVRKDLPALEQALNRFIVNGQQVHYFEQLWVKWSAYQDPALSNLLILDKGHRLTLLSAVLLLIMFGCYQLRKVRQQRNRARHDLRLLLDHSTQGIIATDAHRQVRFVNQRACSDFNLTDRELKRADLYHLAGSQLLESDLVEAQRQQLLRAILNHRPLQLRLTVKEPHLALHFQPLPSGEALLSYSRVMDTPKLPVTVAEETERPSKATVHLVPAALVR